MKRFLLILLAALLICPVALAAPEDYLGTWVYSVENATGDGWQFQIFILDEDGICYYTNQMYSSEEPGFGRSFVGTWREIRNGVHIKYGNNTEDDFILDGKDLRNKSTRIPLIRVGGEEKLPKGAIRVPVGTFTAGVDFPAGRYTVSVGEDILLAMVEVHENEKDTIGTTYWLGSSNGGTTAVLDFPEGSILELLNQGVILTTFTGLTIGE